MYSLQTKVTLGDRELTITNKGDFRMVLDCFNALNDEEISEDSRLLATLLIFYNEFNSVQDIYSLSSEELEYIVTEMYKFFNCGQTEPVGSPTSRPLIDWAKDEQMICSAVNNVANTEIRSLEYLHWWTFMGYYMAIGESVMSTVVSIRDKLTKGKKLEKWEQDFKRDNPDYFNWRSTDVEAREFEAQIRELWNRG